MIKAITEYAFTKALNRIDNKKPHTFVGKLNDHLISDLTFSIYGESIIHLFDPTNTDQAVDQYYEFE